MAKVVERWAWKAKEGCKDELVELTKAWVERHDLAARVYTFAFGDWDAVSADLDFETMEDREEFWHGVDWSQPEDAEVMKNSRALRESGVTVELLHLH